MSANHLVSRRGLIKNSVLGVAALTLAACDELSEAPASRRVLFKAEELTKRAQRLLLGDTLAPEYSEADISPDFRANGTVDPDDEDYRRLAQTSFADWKLKLGGLIDKPAELSLADLRG